MTIALMKSGTVQTVPTVPFGDGGGSGGGKTVLAGDVVVALPEQSLDLDVSFTEVSTDVGLPQITVEIEDNGLLELLQAGLTFDLEN